MDYEMWKGPTPAGLYLASLSWAGFVSVGIVLQVLQTTNNSTATITAVGIASSLTPTSTMGTQLLSQAITPASTFNRVLAFAQVCLTSTDASGATESVVLFRGTTVLESNAFNNTSTLTGMNATLVYLDSPGSTAAQTYSVRVGQSSTSSTPVLPNPRVFGNTALCTLTVAELTS
jgi:hypothetical protein